MPRPSLLERGVGLHYLRRVPAFSPVEVGAGEGNAVLVDLRAAVLMTSHATANTTAQP